MDHPRARLAPAAALALAAGLALNPTIAFAGDPPAHGPYTLLIDSPLDGAILPGNEQRRVVARFDPPIDLDDRSLEATVEAIGPEGTVTLASGDVRTRDLPSDINTIWNLEEMPPGDYTLRVTASSGEASGSAEVAVTVQPPPVVDLRLSLLEATGHGVEAVVEVAASSPAGSPIVEYRLTPGDGGPSQVSEEPRFTLLFPWPGGVRSVWVEATDDTGTSTLVGRDLHLPYDLPLGRRYAAREPRGPLVAKGAPPLPQEELLKKGKACGCEHMTLIGGGDTTRSGLYCVSREEILTDPRAFQVQLILGCEARANPPAGTCEKGEIAFHCPIGQRVPTAVPFNPRFAWGFEVVAALSGSDEKGRCTHGQYARGSTTINGFPRDLNGVTRKGPPPEGITLPGGRTGRLEVMAVGPPARYPERVGPKFGTDDFAGKDLLVNKRRGNEIRWYDQPYLDLNKIDPRATTVQDDREFVAFVRGNGNRPTCWCRFLIDHGFATDGRKPPPRSRFAIIDGNYCYAGPGVTRLEFF